MGSGDAAQRVRSFRGFPETRRVFRNRNASRPVISFFLTLHLSFLGRLLAAAAIINCSNQRMNGRGGQ